MRRRSSRAITATCLVATVGVAIDWRESHRFRHDALISDVEPADWAERHWGSSLETVAHLSSVEGTVLLVVAPPAEWWAAARRHTLRREIAFSDTSSYDPEPILTWPWWGLAATRSSPTASAARPRVWQQYRLVLTHRSLASACLAWPVGRMLAWGWRRHRRDRRRRQAQCLACGYDLRGSPTRCPECGVAAAAGT